jgi:hypothetical protein
MVLGQIRLFLSGQSLGENKGFEFDTSSKKKKIRKTVKPIF